MSYIISELHGQYGGKIEVAEQMILQSKFGGADAAKVQLYSPDFDSKSLNGDKPGDYLSLTFDELKHLQEYAATLHIDFFASFFDEERLEWCLKLNFPILKIANWVSVNKRDLAKKSIDSGKPVIMSVNNDIITKEGKPFDAPNVHYLYTESLYPGMVEELHMPDFKNSFVEGFSDPTAGITAVAYALAHGAKIIEKHFTLDYSWQKTKEKAHFAAMDVDQLRQIKSLARGFDVLENKKVFQFESYTFPKEASYPNHK